jgi:phosphatidate cytidylyltransferase
MNGPMTRITIGAGLIAGTAALLVADVVRPNLGFAYPEWAPAFWAIVTAGLLIGTYEFTRLLKLKGYPCQPLVALVFIDLLIAATWFDVFGTLNLVNLISITFNRGPYVCVLVALVLVAFLVEILAVERRGCDIGRAAQSVAWTVLAVMTVGVPGIFAVQIRFLDADPWRGLMYLTLFLGTVKAGDIGAYAIGSMLGRHKLTPTISPKKSYEGLAGGLAAGTGAALAIGCLWGGFGWWQMLIFGLIVSIAGVLGDLAESLLKRACGVKDSGAIPGFGGVLDILDSILGAAPVAYLLLLLLTH